MIDFLKGTITPQDWMAVGAIVGVTALLAVVFIFVVNSGQKDKLQTLTTTNDQVVKDLNHAKTTRDNYDQLEQEIEKIGKLVSQFEQRLPRRQEIARLVTEFEAIANEVNVGVDFTTLPPSQDPRKETLPYNVTARGNFHQVATFINRLERFRRFMKVSDIDIRPEIEGVCEANFTLSTFRFLSASEMNGAAS